MAITKYDFNEVREHKEEESSSPISYLSQIKELSPYFTLEKSGDFSHLTSEMDFLSLECNLETLVLSIHAQNPTKISLLVYPIFTQLAKLLKALEGHHYGFQCLKLNMFFFQKEQLRVINTESLVALGEVNSNQNSLNAYLFGDLLYQLLAGTTVSLAQCANPFKKTAFETEKGKYFQRLIINMTQENPNDRMSLSAGIKHINKVHPARVQLQEGNYSLFLIIQHMLGHREEMQSFLKNALVTIKTGSIAQIKRLYRQLETIKETEELKMDCHELLDRILDTENKLRQIQFAPKEPVLEFKEEDHQRIQDATEENLKNLHLDLIKKDKECLAQMKATAFTIGATGSEKTNNQVFFKRKPVLKANEPQRCKRNTSGTKKTMSFHFAEEKATEVELAQHFSQLQVAANQGTSKKSRRAEDSFDELEGYFLQYN